jgi:UDP-N-acetylglucosamine 4,6-dehydratase
MNKFNNKRLLITGGTGSFGKAVLNRFLNTQLKEIRIFSRDEKKQDEMRNLYNDNKKINFFLGDVRNKSSINQAMFDIDIVFHAAALKQVPSCEFFPMEAVNTNIIGANNLIDCAIEHNVEKVILLSTDKAVYPINSMGLSKALMEKIMVAKSRIIQKNKKTILCATRYGNVMASRGSVIPHFFKQIKKNNEITITNPLMTRFLMSLDESVDLVVYAFLNGKNGEIFVRKSPASSVEDLAKAIIQITKQKCKIKYIGTRHGEKIYETLVSQEEMLNCKSYPKFYKILPDNRSLDYKKYFSIGAKNSPPDSYTSHNTTRLSINQIIRKIKNLRDFDNEKFI